MEYLDFSNHLERSVPIRLLRSDNAPLALYFLQLHFKKTGKVSQSANLLIDSLDGLLEDLASLEPGRYPRHAPQYLDYWTDQGFLRKFYSEGSDEPVFQLMPGTEKALSWLDDLKAAEFVGTESRLKRIMGDLRELVENTTRDPEIRLKTLETQKSAIESEMKAIRDSGLVETFSGTQIKERFQELLSEGRRLLSDFKQVENNFREICRQLQATRFKEGFSKGKAVKKVLDADDEMKESDQGRSFDAFWKFLRSPSMQSEFRDLVESVYSLPELQSIPNRDPFLKKMKSYMMEAADDVLKTNHRLADQLRRMLVERELQEAQRVSILIAEIKSKATLFRDSTPDDPDFYSLEGDADMDWAMERPLWRPPVMLDFSGAAMDSDGNLMDDAGLSALFTLFHVDIQMLRGRIQASLSDRPFITLQNLLEIHPVDKGLAEIVAYLQIAAQGIKNKIEPEETWTVTFSSEDNSFDMAAPSWQIPKITFIR